MFKPFGALYLILGTCIAAGMLGLPIVTASDHFLLTTMMLIFAWGVMTTGAWCLLFIYARCFADRYVYKTGVSQYVKLHLIAMIFLRSFSCQFLFFMIHQEKWDAQVILPLLSQVITMLVNILGLMFGRSNLANDLLVFPSSLFREVKNMKDARVIMTPAI